MEIKITSDMNPRDKKSTIQPLVDKKQLLVILEIGDNDSWQSYPELIGKSGKFIMGSISEIGTTNVYVFKTDKPVEINVFDSKTLQDTFLFTDVILGVVHTNMDSINEEISIHQGTDEEHASDKLGE